MKKLRTLCVASVLMVSTVPYSGLVYANEGTNASIESVQDTSLNYVELLGDLEIYNGETFLGNLYKGSQIYVKKVEGDLYFTQWSANVSVEIPKDKIRSIEDLNIDGSEEDPKSDLEQITLSNVDIFSDPDLGISMGKLGGEDSYYLIEKNDNYLKILLGNQESYVDASIITGEDMSDSDSEQDSVSEEPVEGGTEEDDKSESDTIIGETDANSDTENAENDSAAPDINIEGDHESAEEVTEDASGSNKDIVNQPKVTSASVNKMMTTMVQDTNADKEFTLTDRYFEVISDNLSLYIKTSNGNLKSVGSLVKGESYPRISDGGNWHVIKYGQTEGYVWKGSTKPVDTPNIQNLIDQKTNSIGTVTASSKLNVYDNSNGALELFGYIENGQQVNIIAEHGNWYSINFAGREGFIYKPSTYKEFQASDQYFKVKDSDVPIYIKNSAGELVKTGNLKVGQSYRRTADLGNWHEIIFNGQKAFVWKESTTPSSSSELANPVNSSIQTGRQFKAAGSVTAYDNSGGQLIPIAELQSGTNYKIRADYGNWISIELAGRIAFVYRDNVRISFNNSDSFFKITGADAPIYKKNGNNLVRVGTLSKDQVFPRIRDIGNWHEVKLGNSLGYVWEEASNPVTTHNLKNLNNGQANSGQSFTTTTKAIVYDYNSYSTRVPFAIIDENIEYPFIAQSGNWILIDINGRIGYVYKDNVSIGHSVSSVSLEVYSTYADLAEYTRQNGIAQLSFGDQVLILEENGYAAKVRTLNGNITGWVQKEYLDSNLTDNWWFLKDGRNLRSAPSSVSDNIGYIPSNTSLRVLDYERNAGSAYEHWFLVKTIDNQQGWVWGSSVNGFNLIQYEKESYNGISNTFSVFTPLNSKTTFTADQLNSFISSKTNSSSYMYGMGSAYIQAQETYGLNAIYLLAHSALETGFGTSDIVKTKYNYYGIHAFDACPAECASSYDGKSAGIIDGAKWINQNYVSRDAYKQFTVDSMRNNNNTHQYATDEAWHVKISKIANELIDFVTNIFK